MKPNLNKADIELLKGTFATKQDLSAMEKRIESDLIAMDKRFDAKFPTKNEMNQRFETLEIMIVDSFQSQERRVSKLERTASIATN